MNRRILGALVVVGLALGAGSAWAVSRTKLAHLAMPALVDPSQPSRTPVPLESGADCSTDRIADLGFRVSALHQTGDGTLWIGGFDAGLFRLEHGARAPERVSGLRGRELFVNAIASFDDRIYAATSGGLVELDEHGTKLRTHPHTSEALLATSDALYVGTAAGLHVLTDQGLELRVPGRVNALAASAGRIWLGTPRGVRSISEDGSAPRWHPLVFGATAASSNVVMALAPTDDGVIASTDDAGLVHVRADRDPVAVKFERSGANLGNPGAAAIFGEHAVFGTQGGGLLFARTSLNGVHAIAADAEALTHASALFYGSRLFVGTEGGVLYAASCGPREVVATRAPAR